MKHRYKIGKRLGSLWPLYVLKSTKKSRRLRWVCIGFITGKDNVESIRDLLN